MTIGDSTFNSCISLTSVVIPDTVPKIGDRAFMFCTSLTTVVISDSVNSIGAYTFYCCFALSEVNLGSVGTIGEYAFYKCMELTSVTIPDSVTSMDIGRSLAEIGYMVFGYCESLDDVTMWHSTSIGGNAFYGSGDYEVHYKTGFNTSVFRDIDNNSAFGILCAILCAYILIAVVAVGRESDRVSEGHFCTLFGLEPGVQGHFLT